LRHKPGVYIDVATVAERLGDQWDTQRTRRWLKRAGALVKHGSRYYTTRSRLRSAFPDAYQERFMGEF
jgi:hypothetical protein